MTRSLITNSAPFKAWKDLLRLVLTMGFPLKTFLATSGTRMRLRTIKGRRRSYAFRIDQPRRISARSSPKSSPKGSPKGSPKTGKTNPRIQSGRIAKRPQRRITKFPKDVAGNEPAGLYNPGTFCYRRALLQCLLHVPSLYTHFEKSHKQCNEEDQSKCVACALKTFFHTYWNDRQPGNFPTGAVKKLDKVLKASFDKDNDGTFREILCTIAQADPHEFLLTLWHKLGAQAKEMQPELEQLFMLDHEISWTCEDCGEKHVRGSGESKEKGLLLPLAGQTAGANSNRDQELSLHGLLKGYYSEDTVEIRCEAEEGCELSRLRDSQLGVEHDASSKDRLVETKIARGPEVLCINMKRSYQELTLLGARDRKLSVDVDYPEELDLSAYTVGNKPLKYRLFGVAAHSGRDCSSGHWIAAVRHANGKNYRTINDTMVQYNEDQTFEELRHPDSYSQEFDPTLLVYVKVAGN